jgi:NAD(P)-dependent dehydrogenase (short-subunit alcohol dehydrogenase family)
MSTQDLKGKWALILGASSGLGAATAHELAQHGVNVIGLYLGKGHGSDAVKAQVAELEALGAGAQIHFIRTNVANPERRKNVIGQIKTLTQGHPIHLMLHSVAFGSLALNLPDDPTQALTQSQMEMTLDVMANSLVYWSQALFYAGLLSKGSRIFSTSSAGSQQFFPYYGAVGAAKAALESHTRSLAAEFAKHGVLVNSLLVGVVDTPAMRKIPHNDVMVQNALRRNPSGRLTTAEDVARTIRVLCDPDLNWITGAVIPVDGGELVVN